MRADALMKSMPSVLETHGIDRDALERRSARRREV
jgi:hypothetical protein